MSSTVRVLTGELGERMARICLRTASSFRMRSASLRSFQIDSSDGRSERGAGVRSGAGRRSVGESTRDSTLGRFADHCTDGWSCRCYCAPTATTNAGAQTVCQAERRRNCVEPIRFRRTPNEYRCAPRPAARRRRHRCQQLDAHRLQSSGRAHASLNRRGTTQRGYSAAPAHPTTPKFRDGRDGGCVAAATAATCRTIGEPALGCSLARLRQHDATTARRRRHLLWL
jgi:hypothetical protein